METPLSSLPAGFVERPVWRRVHGLWRPLYGGFAEHGVSVEWHDFRVAAPLSWSQSFHQRSLEICLNYTGDAEFAHDGDARAFGAGQIALYTTRDEELRAERHEGSMHRFLTLELSAEYLRSQFAGVFQGLLPGVLRFLDNPERFAPMLDVRELPAGLLPMRLWLLEPPVSATARGTWYQSKVLEVLAQTLFRADQAGEFFCHRHRRVNRDRVARVQYLLERDIENPPSLEMLAREAECSPFYLSRLFSEEAGVSIPKYLRMKRVERAADLLRGEGMSVTDAAMAVGYSSLSAFQRAFVERFGMPPGRFGATR